MKNEKEAEIVEELMVILQETMFNATAYFEDSIKHKLLCDLIVDTFDDLIYYCQECQYVLGSVDEITETHC